jgi:ribosome-binding protein aMBF1 (putative translation factor)
MEQFKEKVKALRERRGWSQEDLAREIDVSLSTIQRWEKKDSKPTRLARRVSFILVSTTHIIWTGFSLSS